MKAKNKAFVSGILPRLPFLNDLISKVSSGSIHFSKKAESAAENAVSRLKTSAKYLRKRQR